MGRSRVKGSLKRAVFDHPGEILTDSAAMRALRGNWAESLGGAAPLHLEVGMGRGRFLAELAAREDPVPYVGLQLKPDRSATAREKILKPARRPFVLLNAAAEILPQLFAPGEVERIYLNFPDPWPSFVYRGRRLFGEGSLRVCEQGRDYHATDHAYRAFQTEYERRYRAAGAPICHARLIKTGPGVHEIRSGC